MSFKVQALHALMYYICPLIILMHFVIVLKTKWTIMLFFSSEYTLHYTVVTSLKCFQLASVTGDW